jgi:hypothetical protein
MNSVDLYNKHREDLRDGDIILCHSKKFIAKAIRHGRVFVMDAHPDKGVHPGFLSHRMAFKQWDDIAVLRPKINKKRIEQSMNQAFSRAHDYIPYDMKGVFQILMYQKLGMWAGTDHPGKDICSEFTQYYGIYLGIEEYFPRNLSRPFFTPQDHIRVETDMLKRIL